MVSTAMRFPAAWPWVMDELIPSFVKGKYSPREGWKDKPFAKEDVRFFSKGIEELSDLFTEERGRALNSYFLHPKFRSAYLLYFLPLQAAKFLTLFSMYPGAMSALRQPSKEKSGVLRIADLGAGPGTASIALLLWLMENRGTQEVPPIEFHWFDMHLEIMRDGETLIQSIASQFPSLRGKITVHLHHAPWWTAEEKLPGKPALTLMGHVLNETPRQSDEFWAKFLPEISKAGVLMVEPAGRKTSQGLSYLRDKFFERQWLPQNPQRIWGPCLHAGACPLARGKDWCHFSIPSQIPGKFFKDFSKALGSERHWLKFSYLWLASSDFPAPRPAAQARRVISDSLSKGVQSIHLLCEPEKPRRWSAPRGTKVWRGDIVKWFQEKVRNFRDRNRDRDE